MTIAAVYIDNFISVLIPYSLTNADYNYHIK